MSNILDEDVDEQLQNTGSPSLLYDWIAEQKTRFIKILNQLDLISNIPADNLDELGDRLDDIDFHSASLNNILGLVLANTDDSDITEEEITKGITNHDYLNSIDKSYSGDEPLLGKANRWPLLQALWFHVMMATDPESIYYSANIGKNNWTTTNEYAPEFAVYQPY